MSMDTFKLAFLFIILALEACHGVSSSKESITKAGEVDYAKCVTDNDCIPVPPYLDCMGASARCYKGTCYCYYGIKESGVSSSKKSITKTGEVDYAKCVTDNDCIPYPPYLDCMGASARCYKGTCYCYWG